MIEMGEMEVQEVEVKVQEKRLEKGAVRRRDIVRDLLLKQSAKSQEQILCDMLVRTGAAKEVQDSFKLELSRPQGGRHLEVQRTAVYCSIYCIVEYRIQISGLLLHLHL